MGWVWLQRAQEGRPVDIFELSDRLVDEIATLSPIAATYMGIPGHDHLWQDFSPAGVAAAAEVLVDYEVGRGNYRNRRTIGSVWPCEFFSTTSMIH